MVVTDKKKNTNLFRDLEKLKNTVWVKGVSLGRT
jgi:hypothetical protein